MKRVFSERLPALVGVLVLLLGVCLPWTVAHPSPAQSVYIPGYADNGLFVGVVGCVILFWGFLLPATLPPDSWMTYTLKFLIVFLFLMTLDAGNSPSVSGMPCRVGIGVWLSRGGAFMLFLSDISQPPGSKAANSARRFVVKNFLLGVLFCVALVSVGFTLLHPWSVPPALAKAEMLWGREQCRQAQQRWQARNVRNYDLQVDTLWMASQFSGDPFVLRVRSGEPVAVKKPLNSGQFETITDTATVAWRRSLLVDEMLREVEITLNDLDPSEYYLFVTFDDEYGFVKEYTFGCVSAFAVDCESNARFSNFRHATGE